MKLKIKNKIKFFVLNNTNTEGDTQYFIYSNMEYYVYVLLNPLKKGDFNYGDYHFDYEPFYIGKGKGKRKTNTLSEKKNLFKKRVIEKIKLNGLKPILILLKEDLNETDSFKLEKELIIFIGRRDLDTGCLCNFTNGGEGSSGIIQSEETKKKRKESLLPYRAYFKTEEFSLKMKEVAKERIKNKDYIDKMKILSEKYKGSGNPMFGKSTSDKQKESVKNAHLSGKINISEEGKRKIKEAQKNRKKNTKKRSDIKNYILISPSYSEYIVLGNANLQKFCSENKIQYQTLRKTTDIITNENINENSITGKNTIGWQKIIK